jgi:predicted aspartyl protease
MRSKRGIIFPYKTYRGFPCPIVTVRLNGFDVEAYVDSGAFYSIFSAYEAEVVGIDFKKGKSNHIIVGDGNTIPVYFHTLPITIGNVTFNAVIGFSQKLGVGFNLLGRRSIFEKFVIVFDDSKKQITFIPR